MPHYVIEPKSKEPAEEGEQTAPVLLRRIVEAKNPAQALAHVVEDTLVVRLAKPADLVAHGKAGREIEQAK